MSVVMKTPTNEVYDVNINTYTPDELKELCQKLEEMSKINQVEALRIFHKHNKEMINENIWYSYQCHRRRKSCFERDRRVYRICIKSGKELE